MIPNELLIRTIHAAKDARERGFDCTADAFDEIVEHLLNLMHVGSSYQSENAMVKVSKRIAISRGISLN